MVVVRAQSEVWLFCVNGCPATSQKKVVLESVGHEARVALSEGSISVVVPTITVRVKSVSSLISGGEGVPKLPVKEIALPKLLSVEQLARLRVRVLLEAGESMTVNCCLSGGKVVLSMTALSLMLGISLVIRPPLELKH